jgi:hypothetical protein
MNGFDITFLTSPVPDDTPFTAYGRITIGEFTELFQSPLTFWKDTDYQTHWLVSLRRLLNGHERSCLITSITDPTVSSYLFWWPCYRVGTQVIFQNQLLFFDKLAEPFRVENPYRFVSNRETFSDEDGLPISEWAVSISCISQFLHEKENMGAV